MSTRDAIPQKSSLPQALTKIVVTFVLLIVGIGLLAVGLFAVQTGLAAPFLDQLRALFAVDSVQIWWYVTRAAGLMAYLLLWFSTTWGLAVSSKIFDPWLERMFTYDFHEHLSLLGLGFAGLHVVVLMIDQFQPFSIWQVLFPFISTYRPLWVGIGILTFYISILVSVTFYIRARISQQTFRTIHYLSLAAYLGAALHGIFAGTDTPLMATGFMYALTFLVTVFLCAYWLVVLWLRKKEEKEKALQLARSRRRGTSAPKVARRA